MLQKGMQIMQMSINWFGVNKVSSNKQSRRSGGGKPGTKPVVCQPNLEEEEDMSVKQYRAKPSCKC